MKKFLVGTFEGFVFPATLFIATLSLVAELVVITPWFITNVFHSGWVNYCLVMGTLSFPVGMVLVCFRPNYGNETWIARFYNRHYTKERRALYFALNGVVGYMVMTSIARVFDKEAQVFLIVAGLMSVFLLFVVCLVYMMSRTTFNRA